MRRAYSRLSVVARERFGQASALELREPEREARVVAQAIVARLRAQREGPAREHLRLLRVACGPEDLGHHLVQETSYDWLAIAESRQDPLVLGDVELVAVGRPRRAEEGACLVAQGPRLSRQIVRLAEGLHRAPVVLEARPQVEVVVMRETGEEVQLSELAGRDASGRACRLGRSGIEPGRLGPREHGEGVVRPLARVPNDLLRVGARARGQEMPRDLQARRAGPPLGFEGLRDLQVDLLLTLGGRAAGERLADERVAKPHRRPVGDEDSAGPRRLRLRRPPTRFDSGDAIEPVDGERVTEQRGEDQELERRLPERREARADGGRHVPRKRRVRGERANGRVAVDGLDQAARAELVHELLDEERIPVRDALHRVDEGVRCGRHAEVADHRLGLGGRKPVELDRGGDRLAAQLAEELPEAVARWHGPVRDDDHQREPLAPRAVGRLEHELPEQVEAGGVRPVQVVEDDERRLAAGKRPYLLGDGEEVPQAVVLGVARCLRGGRGARHRPRAQRGRGSVQRSACAERARLEDAHERQVRDRGVLDGASVGDLHLESPCQRAEFAQEARLADPRLAAGNRDPGLAAEGMPEGRGQTFELDLATDERVLTRRGVKAVREHVAGGVARLARTLERSERSG